ncbi:uncharacterized protein TRAVEDRAFT_49098 [Trametes versicolor FP-101664 SS1]|uniref:uncharacterized protein n=1 Tax=Trametes versicolor (strain FP-101664) TaxID=717944 RepID=UPI0004623494|nr:uncharacterized protein TRAVEDRAFT_49098 [Trametes versicolor FP-101664 SS1]EIW56258.1 hypothetical protein TRAVEDRAFT_49098 [Trametes versicolor FP-101664 SS1]
MVPSSSSSPAPSGGSGMLAQGDASLLQDTTFTKTSQELIQFVTQLRALGAQVYLDLPRIVVIGNQSAGKSSLVEGVSGISVPRDAGTCTRCPMECRLGYTADAWSCQISVRWEFDSTGQRLEEVQEVPFGPRLTDKTLVEPMLRRAQAAILSASGGTGSREAAVARFVGMDLEEVRRSTDPKTTGAKALAFSRNTICVDLAGPDLVDLSFVDLPGIVQNAEAEVVKLVEDLVTSYVEGNCLILVALPMSDDIENQKAARIAKHADPQGVRTIGVLTKPDTIPAGSTKRRDMYFATRNTLPASSSSIFKCLAFVFVFGATCAFSYGRNGGALPRIAYLNFSYVSRLACTRRVCRGEPSTSSTTSLRNLVTRSSTNADGSDVTAGGSPSSSLFVAASCAATSPMSFGSLSHPPPSSLMLRTRFCVPNRCGHVDPLHGTVVRKKSASAVRAAAGVIPASRWSSSGWRVQSVTRELPNNIPYPAKRSLIHEFQESWEAHVLDCFDRVQVDFKTSLGELVKHRFERFSHLKGVVAPALMEQVNACANETLANVHTILKLERAAPYTQNTHYLADKRDKQLAQYKQARAFRAGRAANGSSGRSNGDSEDDSEEEGSAGGSGSGGGTFSRAPSKLAPKEKETLLSALAELTRLGYPVKEDDLGKLNPPDEYQEELEVMAEVRAYFQVSYKRIIDYIPLSIDQHFLYALAERLQGVLIEKLGLGSAKADARCAQYVAEDPHINAQRAELLAKKKKLESVQRALFNFGL